MLGLQKKETPDFIYILSSTGDFRMKVEEYTPDAVKRVYETSDGKTGEKWEIAYDKLAGNITGIEFFEGDYGKNLLVAFSFSEEADPVTLSVGVATPFGEDLMKKLPNIDLSKVVEMSPYSFEDENGKTRRGISIVQEEEKVKNAFFDPENKKNLLGYPEPEGDTSTYDKDDWKIYFTKARKFLVSYIEETILPQLETEEQEF